MPCIVLPARLVFLLKAGASRTPPRSFSASSVSRPMTHGRNDLVCLALLWLCGTAMRLTILAVPPLILPIRDALQLSATGVGILIALPIAMFAIAALPGSLLIARLGPQPALVCGLLLTAAGTALRGGAWDAATLYGATIVMGAGVAIMQPAMPVLVREWLPSRIGLATAIYTNGLLAGAILVVWFMPAVMPLFGNSWRPGLAIWSVPVLLTALSFVALAPPSPRERPRTGNPRFWRPDWENPLIWRLGLMFGSVNAAYFATSAFLPPYLRSLGRDDLVQPALTAMNFCQLPASLLIAAAAKRLELRAWPYICAGTGLTVSVIGLVFIPGAWTVFWAGLLGFSVAAGLILGLSLPPLLAGPADVGRMSAAMFTLSYAMAVVISFLCGAISDLTGSPGWAFAPIGLYTLTLIASALALRADGKLT
jgi:MFS transporter, CP family, cyanate transporter